MIDLNRLRLLGRAKQNLRATRALVLASDIPNEALTQVSVNAIGIALSTLDELSKGEASAPGTSEPDPPDTEADDAKALAIEYADLWSALEAVGLEVPEAEQEAARHELEGSPWTVARDEDGDWAAQHEGDVQLSTERSPTGGVTIGGKIYPGGQFIPSSVIEHASAEDKAKLAVAKDQAETAKQQKADARRDRGVDVGKLKERLEPHAAAELSKGERARAAASFRLLQKHHGDLFLHRVEELTDQAEKGLAAVRDDNPRAAELRSYFKGQLAKYHTMTAKPDSLAPQRQPGKAYTLKTSELHVDPARFQYKVSGIGSGGVGQELKGTDKFDPDLAGVVAVWKDPENGKSYVVNGHHRYELAERTGHPHLLVRYLDAKDAKEARAKGAVINIAEGRGTALDAAKFLRDTGRTIDDLKAQGVSVSGRIASDAAALTNLNDKLFHKLTQEEIDEQTALAIGRHLHDGDKQNLLMKIIEKEEDKRHALTPRDIEEMAREMAETPTTKREETTLFGTDTYEESLFVERAELKAHVRAELSKEVNDWAAVASKRRAGNVAKGGNVLDVEANKEQQQIADQAKNVFATLVNRKGPISDSINAAAAEYAAAKTKKQREAIKKQATEGVRDAVKRELGFGDAGQAGSDSASAGPDAGRPVEPALPGSDAVRGGESAGSSAEGAADGGGPKASGTGVKAEVGEKVTVPASHTAGSFEAEFTDEGNGRIGLQQAGSKDGPSVVFKDKSQAQRFLGDLSGKVTGKPDSPDTSINHVLSDKAKFLGRGNDGLAFDTGDGNVVKVSSEVPYHWNNGLRSAEDGAKRLREQVKANDQLLAANVPGILPQKLIEHDGRAFVVMPRLNLEDPLTAEHLEQVKESLKAAHAAGFTFGDEIQAGIGQDGKAYVFDTGATRKLGKAQDRAADIQDDESRLARLYEKAEVPFKGVNPSLDYDGASESIKKEIESGKPVSPGKVAIYQKKLERLFSNLEPDERDLLADNHKELLGKLKGGGAAKPAELTPPVAPKSTEIPAGVRATVEHAVSVLKDYEDALAQARIADQKFKGEGRYEEEVRDKFENDPDKKARLNKARERIESFRKLAAGNNVDADAVLESMGHPRSNVEAGPVPSLPAGDGATPSSTAPSPSHHDSLKAIPVGELHNVGGLMVRRTGDDAYRIDTPDRTITGDAAEIQRHIERADANASKAAQGRTVQAALDRVKATPPATFMEAHRANEEADGFKALPNGSQVVVADADDPNYGKMGEKVTGDDGRAFVRLENGSKYSGLIEPLDAKHSWRLGDEEKAARDAEAAAREAAKPKQADMFAPAIIDALGGKPEAVEANDVMATLPPAERKKVELVRAPAGGAVSDVNGEHYEGGRLMPIHGKYAGIEKLPKSEGVGAPSAPAKPNEEGKGPVRSPAKPLTPEELEEHRQGQERQREWDKAKATPLGELLRLGARPHEIKHGLPLKEWKEFAEKIGPEKMAEVKSRLQTLWDATSQRARGKHPDLPDDNHKWFEDSPERVAKEHMQTRALSGTKQWLASHPDAIHVRQLIEHLLTSNDNLSNAQADLPVIAQALADADKGEAGVS